MSSSTASGPQVVTIRLFAAYAELVGCDTVDIAVSAGATIGELLSEFRRQVPAAAPLPSRLLCAVNLAHVLPSHVLQPGDEVAILPPLAGG